MVLYKASGGYAGAKSVCTKLANGICLEAGFVLAYDSACVGAVFTFFLLY